MDGSRLPALWGRIRAEELAQLTGAHRTTAARWKRLVRIPRWLELLVATIIEGRLDAIARDWRGWRIAQGVLVSPEGLHFTPGRVRALPQLLELRGALEAEIRQLRLEIARRQNVQPQIRRCGKTRQMLTGPSSSPASCREAPSA